MSAGPGICVRFTRPGVVEPIPADPLAVGPAQVRIRTRYSGISAGTETTAYLGTNPYLHRHWDQENRLFRPGPPTVEYPIDGWGYEEVGEVVELGEAAAGVAIGDVVWGIWGHRSDGVLPADQARRQTLPAGTDPRVGIFARVGAVALNAVIEADLHVGETVAVFGQGVIGLLATRLAQLNGAEVIAVDTAASRLERARHFGARHVVQAPAESAALLARELTGGRGADASIELSGTYPGLQEAIRTVGHSGRVVASGFYQGEAAGLRLGEEFHHNRVELVSSQISGPPPRYAHRWTRERLHEEFVRLVLAGRVDPLPLVTDVLPVAEVAAAFELITAGDPATLQVLLDFAEVPA